MTFSFYMDPGIEEVVGCRRVISLQREQAESKADGKYPLQAFCFNCTHKENCDIMYCKVFRGKDPENAYDDYIKGIRSFIDVNNDYKG